MAAYKDIVMGANGETSPLSQRPYAYFAMDVAQPIPNIGIDTNKTLSDPDLSLDAESLTFDGAGAANSAGSTRFTNGGENLQNYNGLNVTMEQFSVALWVKHDLSSDGLLTPTCFYRHYNNPRGTVIGLLPGGGTIFSWHRAGADGNGGTAIGASLAGGERRFLVGTVHRLNGRIRIYENGVLAEEALFNVGNAVNFGASSSSVGGSQSIKFGTPTLSTAGAFGNYNGLMAHLMIWRDYEITAADVAALYAAGSGPQGATLTLNGVQLGSDVVIKDPAIVANGSDNNVIARFSDVASASVGWTYSSAPPVVDVEIYRAGFKLFAVRGVATGADGSIPVAQQPDPVYA